MGSLSGPVRDWFAGAFPQGPTPAQRLAWPPIAAGEHMLLVSPTGTGKTLTGFLAILDRLFRRAPRASSHRACAAFMCLRCGVWATTSSATWRSRSRQSSGCWGPAKSHPCRRADGRYLGLFPPPAPGPAAAHLDHDAGESLALAQPGKLGRPLARVQHVIVDEVHALVPTKRGADLAVCSSASRQGEPRSRPGWPVGHLPACRPWRGSWWDRREPAAWSKHPCPAARRPWRSRSKRCWRLARLRIAA